MELPESQTYHLNGLLSLNFFLLLLLLLIFFCFWINQSYTPVQYSSLENMDVEEQLNPNMPELVTIVLLGDCEDFPSVLMHDSAF